MKQPNIGKIVYWYNGGDRSNGANPAIVTAVTHNAVRLSVFQPGSSGIRATNWCRHIDDPWNADHKVARDEHGAWDWMDQMDAGLEGEVWLDESHTEEVEQAVAQNGPLVISEIPTRKRKSKAN